ncbi:hypothetical protein MKW98_007477 [Papaver atlanticum]|uniref:RanBD1 domain-containing protein n=1 Tax=Papaver atlanticum TaxID=357466 RepID=A0AAD4SBA0_9MAGN|nr:hypothetical protein MKW98_007477 [Papaver atlanticum]
MSSKIFNYPEITELAEGFKHIEPKLEEEDEDTLLRLKAKLYRFDKDGNQWKVRGDGILKLLKHKQTKKVRLVMRQSKTMKVIVNHLVLPTISIQKHNRSRKSWFWHATDFSDGELKEEVFCARFESIENAKLFKEMVFEAAECQVQKSEESKEEGVTSLAAYLTEKLYVGEKKDVTSTAESQVQKSEARKEGATSLAAYLTEKLYIGEKKDLYNIFEFSNCCISSQAEI